MVNKEMVIMCEHQNKLSLTNILRSNLRGTVRMGGEMWFKLISEKSERREKC